MKIEQRAELSNCLFSSERFDRVRISPSRGTAHIDRVFWHLPAPRPLSLYSLGHHVLDVRLFFAILDERAKRAFLNASLEFDKAKQAQADNNTGFNAVAGRSRSSATSERQTARERLAEAEADLAELDAYLRVRPTLVARVRESAQNIITSISSFRAACESLISKEKKLVSESGASGMAFRPIFAPYYQQSIEKANETEKKVKIL